MIKLILITNDQEFAQQAELAGVDRIFVDLEILGKQQRQGHLNTHISNHSLFDISRIKSVLKRAELIVRLNPFNEATSQEVENAITEGADTLMLPMYRTAEEVSEFSRMVDNRVRFVPLLETFGATQSIEDVVRVKGVSELYIGLNDLYLDSGQQFIFEPLANGMVDRLAKIIKRAGLLFGFGGVARVGEGTIPGELVLAEHLRLGSSSVILSRTFQRSGDSYALNKRGEILSNEIRKLEATYKNLLLRDKKQIDCDHQRFSRLVRAILDSKNNETTI